MKRILLSVASLLFAGSVLATATGAFFSDTETSLANTFVAGAIDLKIDNESYYNGALSPETSWSLADLTIQKFFNFLDLKPGDVGEDTISLHVDTNDAYLCADITLTSNDDNGLNEPEALDGDLTPGDNEGELASEVNFIWWADDGDNVLESDENAISQGPIGALTLNDPHTVVLADSSLNIWNALQAPGPVAGNTTKYIGKAWCFGTLTPAALAQDGFGAGGPRTPANSSGGISCDGSTLNNISQTDSLTADVSFSAVQARHNDDFLCIPPLTSATLTLAKAVSGPNAAAEWTLSANGPTNISGTSGSGAVTAAVVTEGAYTLGESGGVPGYSASQYSCVVNGGAPVLGNNLNLVGGDVAVCTITNTVNACSPGQKYADVVANANQGVRKDGSLILVDRRNPATALGAPQTTGTPSDAVVTPNSFFALGFNVGTTTTRSLALGFTNNVILNGPGADFKVYEVTGGVYPDEHVKVEASKDGIGWTVVAADVVRDADVDLGPLSWAAYVRLTDINATAPFPNDADGYDVDAVEALNCAVTP